jgi:hypothetical protein
MSEHGKVHFRSKPFMARVEGKGDAIIKCIPVVCDEEWKYSVGIVFEDGTMRTWGPVWPRDLIASWRATEILCRLDTLEWDALRVAWHGGRRKPHKCEMAYVESTIAKIGRNAYDAIMSKPIPEMIIRAILDDQEYDPALYPITYEAQAGTIEWRQEFADAGVEHPDNPDPEKREREKWSGAWA